MTTAAIICTLSYLDTKKVAKGDLLIEGASVNHGELALGQNLLVAFMLRWRGYNMDDAIVISRRLVQDDSLTSINIKDFDVEVRETKLLVQSK